MLEYNQGHTPVRCYDPTRKQKPPVPVWASHLETQNTGRSKFVYGLS